MRVAMTQTLLHREEGLFRRAFAQLGRHAVADVEDEGPVLARASLQGDFLDRLVVRRARFTEDRHLDGKRVDSRAWRSE